MNNPTERTPGTEKIITLPDAATIQAKLAAISQMPRDKALVEKLHPRLLQEAGAELNTTGVAIVILKAARDYLSEVYGPAKDMTSLEGLSLTSNILPKYVDALIEDPTAAAEVKKEMHDAALFSSSLFPPKTGK